eukprot:CAMPEP_0185808420 /NCGR_PEP_ID=MMETSP1322-20130828/5600_1 /TAXON_ID=265543 /ORGANISM="Minutocellus polymorphus, Strain RCC2270" /LENGTH=39 /DNA_ID= /DNA_START= /DNA_END= /DNA_ORIENTATION=
MQRKKVAERVKSHREEGGTDDDATFLGSLSRKHSSASAS